MTINFIEVVKPFIGYVFFLDLLPLDHREEGENFIQVAKTNTVFFLVLQEKVLCVNVETLGEEHHR